MENIYIVIPTYNEKNNIEKLLKMIFELNIKGLNVLVVDDNSPDGTSQLIEKLKNQYANLNLLHRQEKAGLGTAYVAGFKMALSYGAKYIFEMDADLSHHPKYIPDFLDAIKKSDIVLGSRYIKNGGVSNWNLSRRLISRFGNIYARILLGLPYRDLTGGFKCYKRKVLEDLGLDNFSSVGYNFQIESTNAAHKAGFKIVEIPIIFTERAEGKSKFNFKIIIESFYKVLQLRLKK